MGPYIIGIDLGGTRIRLAAVDSEGRILKTEIAFSGVLMDVSDPVAALGDIIESFKADITGRLGGICAGFPGTVGKAGNIVYSCPNLPSFNNAAVSKPLELRFKVPARAEHDIILLMSYDLYTLPTDDMSCVIGVYLGTGLGNAIWANGDFIYGKGGVAGELGHIPVLSKADACPCGNAGCIELYTGGRQLEAMAAEWFPGTPFREIFTRHGRDERLDRYLDAVGTAIAVEVNILDPDVIILGGGVIQMPDFPVERLKKMVASHTRKPFPCDDLRFVMASSETFAGAMGAVRYMQKRLAV